MTFLLHMKSILTIVLNWTLILTFTLALTADLYLYFELHLDFDQLNLDLDLDYGPTEYLIAPVCLVPLYLLVQCLQHPQQEVWTNEKNICKLYIVHVYIADITELSRSYILRKVNNRKCVKCWIQPPGRPKTSREARPASPSQPGLNSPGLVHPASIGGAGPVDSNI